MPYRDPDESDRERIFAIRNELAEIRQRTLELTRLETKKKNLERELLLLNDPEAANPKPRAALTKALSSPGLQTFKQVAAFSTIMFLKGVAVLIVLLSVALVTIRMFAPKVQTADPSYGVPHG
jgi:hypothetical protein